jgi:hypothetical protein
MANSGIGDRLQESLRPNDPGAIGSTEVVSNNIAISAINILLFIAGFIALMSVIWSGYTYITAGGNAKKATDARQRLINAVIGLIIITSVFFFVRIATTAGESIATSDRQVIEISTPASP